MIDRSQVTACLVTRGDQSEMMERILASLIFDNVIVWDNSVRDRDWKASGRYQAVKEATTQAVYFQDDDCFVPPSTQEALLRLYEPGVMVSTYGHGDNPDGLDDLPLVHGGAIVDRDLPLEAMSRYLAVWPDDDDFCYEADFIVGALYPAFRHVELPFEIVMEIAQHPSRMCNQPFQRDLKHKITDRARAIRDMVAA